MNAIEYCGVNTMATSADIAVPHFHESCSRPQVLIGLHVHTSDWDDQMTGAQQRYHFRQGFPCQSDHTTSKGYICGLGFCVFTCRSPGSNIYVAEEPVSIVVQLPDTGSISAQAFRFHGISDAACLHGQDLSIALQPIIALLRQRAQICCHNLPHQTLAFCREFQKRTLMRSPSLSAGDTRLLLNSLYRGHCTMELSKEGNGAYRSLAEVYQHWFGGTSGADGARDPGQNAYKCGCLFSHYTGASIATPNEHAVRLLIPTVLATTGSDAACVGATHNAEAEAPDIKKAKVAVPHELDTCLQVNHSSK